MKKSIVFLLLLSVLYGCAQKNGQENKVTQLNKESSIVIGSFFAEIKAGNYRSALSTFLRKNENIDLSDSLTIGLIMKFNSVNELSGKFMSYRLLRKKELDNDLGVYVYLVKYEKKFYRFTFTFYNNDLAVKVYKFSFDDVIDIELEDGMKLYVN